MQSHHHRAMSFMEESPLTLTLPLLQLTLVPLIAHPAEGELTQVNVKIQGITESKGSKIITRIQLI
jgi:hypothetical protein